MRTPCSKKGGLKNPCGCRAFRQIPQRGYDHTALALAGATQRVELRQGARIKPDMHAATLGALRMARTTGWFIGRASRLRVNGCD
jgi:hypothetical protein